MKKMLFLAGLVVIGALLVVGRQRQNDALSAPGAVMSPHLNQIFTQGSANTISWQAPAGKTAPFIIAYIQTTDDKVFGTIDSQTNSSSLTWKADHYFRGDIGVPLPKGNYKIKIVGYNSDFCYNGDCAPGSKTSAVAVYTLSSEVFAVQ